MASNRGVTKKNSHGAKLGDKNKAKGKPSGLGPNTKTRVVKSKKGPPPKQQKTKSSHGPARKKRRVYTDKELGLPQLNMITPVGVEKPKGKKKGKVFIDDPVRTESYTFSVFKLRALMLMLWQESMMTILAIVNADKEGQIESKMMKSRQMEEIREARKKEAEARHDQRKSKLVCRLVKNLV